MENRLTLIQRLDTHFSLYRCACGTEKRIRHASIRAGLTRSCGCLQKEWARRARLTLKHGMSGTTEFKSWSGILTRCTSPNNVAYPRYGGRGITVCARWRHSFENFFEDMGARPGRGYSIERIDNDGPYDKSNCKWGTAKEQARNRRSTVWLQHEGIRDTLKGWAENLGIGEWTIRRRLRVMSFSQFLHTLPTVRRTHKQTSK